VSRLLHGRPITVRITAGFLCAMTVLFALTGAFIYGRMQYALNRSIQDVPRGDRAELDARRRHRDEALHELLGQLAVAFAGTLLVSGFVGYRVARAALDPVERMRRRASVESVDHSFRLPVPDTADELSRLAETLNDLLARVQASVTREHQLVADASHELRTPLSQLVLQIDLALSRERTPDELRAALLQLQRDASRLVRLANDLLLIARADEGRLPVRPEPVAIRSLFEATAARFQERTREAGRGIAVDVAEDLSLDADSDRLTQALDNLLENAIVHGGGTITLRAVASSAGVALHVADHGPGFAPEFTDHAFDRFSTAASGRTNSGTGLGLSIVAAIASAHGGTAHAANAPDGGADVWMVLPQRARVPRDIERCVTEESGEHHAEAGRVVTQQHHRRHGVSPARSR